LELIGAIEVQHEAEALHAGREHVVPSERVLSAPRISSSGAFWKRAGAPRSSRASSMSGAAWSSYTRPWCGPASAGSGFASPTRSVFTSCVSLRTWAFRSIGRLRSRDTAPPNASRRGGVL